MCISKIWLNVFGEIVGVGGGELPSNHFRLLKSALAFLISNRMSPFWIFYDNSFDTKCPGMKQKNNNNIVPTSLFT
jgi:hypothetical protein